MNELQRMKNEKLTEKKVELLDDLLDKGYEVLSADWYGIKTRIMEAQNKDELDLI